MTGFVPPSDHEHAYIYNPNSKMLHRLPASEACNTDQILNRRRFDTETEAAASLPHGFIRCKRCFRR